MKLQNILTVGHIYQYHASLEGTWYRQIGENGFHCGALNNGVVVMARGCYKQHAKADNFDALSCETACSKYSFCVGYSYAEQLYNCRLYKSSESATCPSEYKPIDGPTATSIDQLIKWPSPIGIAQFGNPDGCYGKIKGKTKVCLKI